MLLILIFFLILVLKLKFNMWGIISGNDIEGLIDMKSKMPFS